MSNRFRYTVIMTSDGYSRRSYLRQAVAEELCGLYEGFTLTEVEGWWRGKPEAAYEYVISTDHPALDAIKSIFTRAAQRAGDLEWIHIERELVTAHHTRVTNIEAEAEFINDVIDGLDRGPVAFMSDAVPNRS